jgi:hypothetical protein
VSYIDVTYYEPDAPSQGKIQGIKRKRQGRKVVVLQKMMVITGVVDE